MVTTDRPGHIIILNGAPRSGKSSIVAAFQRRTDELWMNLGVDRFMPMAPQWVQPGVGLRPGGERPDLERALPSLYAALYESIAAHSRLGLNVIVDVGHHDWYSRPLAILPDCARRLAGLPALFVGVRCPLDAIIARRRATGWEMGEPGGAIERAIVRWQTAVHTLGIYDLEVDTSQLSPEACVAAIDARLGDGREPTALRRLAALTAEP